MTQHESLLNTIINGIALLVGMLVLVIVVPLILLAYMIAAIWIWLLSKLWSLVE